MYKLFHIKDGLFCSTNDGSQPISFINSWEITEEQYTSIETGANIEFIENQFFITHYDDYGLYFAEIIE
jgi:hypothetical protein